jgi:hypothetical protein
MIIRAWRGRASPAKSDASPRHFRETVVPSLRDVPGFLGAQLTRRPEGTRSNFWCSHAGSPWRRSAPSGPAVDKAVVEPGAIAALDDFDDTVRHYEVIEEVSPAR